MAHTPALKGCLRKGEPKAPRFFCASNVIVSVSDVIVSVSEGSMLTVWRDVPSPSAIPETETPRRLGVTSLRMAGSFNQVLPTLAQRPFASLRVTSVATRGVTSM